ncbi:hypothetical protein RI367_008385 [Sorochytrium milnesiophthora]
MDATTGDADALAFVRAVMSKPSWSRKVLDAAVANKYASEAIAQGASSDSVNKALRQLQQLAANSKSAQSSSPRSATPDGAAVLPAETWAAIEKETARYRAYVATRMTEPDRTGRIALYAPVPVAGAPDDDPNKEPETVALDQPNQRPIAEAKILTVDEVSELLDYNSDATWSDCTCDGCQRNIQGTRYFCGDCRGDRWGRTWDLDSECYAKHMAGTLRVRQRYSEEEVADPCPLEHRYFKMVNRDALIPKLQEYLTIKNATEVSQELHAGSVWAADNVVPEQLRQVLLSETARLAQDTIDYHPGSDGKVLDLVHPSLFPYIHGASHVLRPHDPQVQKMMARFDTKYCPSKYQWLPTEFSVDEEGNATVASYINNLDESHYPDLYRAVPQILSLFIPMFEKTLKKSLRQRRIQVIVKAANYQLKPGQSHEGVWHVEGMSHEGIAASGIYYYDCSQDIKDKGLSFRRARDMDDFPYHIDTARDYIRQELLQPYYTIVMRDSGMEGLPDQEQWLAKLQRTEVPRKLDIEPPQAVDLFTVATPPGRMLVFSNTIQHKVAGLHHAADIAEDSGQDQTPYIPQASSEGFDADREEGNLPSKHYDPNTKPRFADNIPTADDPAQQHPVAERKILCFFLVNPEQPILSSANVPRQQWDPPRARRLLDKAFNAKLGQRCPPELLQEVMKHAGSGMTLAQAHAHRLVLMHERKYERDAGNIEYLREYSLCEH